MKNRSLVEDWMKRANSNLSRAQAGKVSEHILYEDLCYDCQQAAEKAIKALLISNNIVPQPTHSLSVLIDDLEKNGIDVPDTIKAAIPLSYYAVETRYPGRYEPVNEREYEQALKMAKTVFSWVDRALGQQR